MAKFSDKIEEPREKEPKKEILSEGVVKEWFPERKEVVERKELTEKEKVERERLKEEIKKVKLPPQKEVEAQKEAEKMGKGTVQGKIKHLLDLAQSKGLSYAVKVAKETKDALIVDLFHDILAKNGLFKKLSK